VLEIWDLWGLILYRGMNDMMESECMRRILQGRRIYRPYLAARQMGIQATTSGLHTSATPTLCYQEGRRSWS
jgi:hypothetical protein